MFCCELRMTSLRAKIRSIVKKIRENDNNFHGRFDAH